MPVDQRARPQRAADIGRQPEAIKTGSDQFEQRTPANKPKKVAPLPGERDGLGLSDQSAYLRNIVHGKSRTRWLGDKFGRARELPRLVETWGCLSHAGSPVHRYT